MNPDSTDGSYYEGLVSVATLDQLRELDPDVERVFVHGLDDEKAGALARLSQLKLLYQDGSPSITDAGLATLADLRTLKILDLEWAEHITDVGLAHLHTLHRLEWIDLGFCRLLTEAGVAAFRVAVPGCEVEGWPDPGTRNSA